MKKQPSIHYDPDLDHPRENFKYNEIKRRWADFSSKDIDLYKDLPEWRVIVEDIYTLFELVELAPHAYGAGYDAGYEDASLYREEEEEP